MRRLFFALIVLLVEAHTVFADAYVLSGVINRRLQPDELVWVDGTAQIFETLALNGTIEISSVPSVIDRGDRNVVSYDIVFDFVFGHGGHLFGTAGMVVDGNGCGLFDCNMAGYASNDFGNLLAWTVDHGAFFNPDGTPYPSVFIDALPYVVPPERFELYGWSLHTISGPVETAQSYHLSGPLVASRVPEPSTLLLMGCALGVLVRSRRRLGCPPLDGSSRSR